MAPKRKNSQRNIQSNKKTKLDESRDDIINTSTPPLVPNQVPTNKITVPTTLQLSENRQLSSCGTCIARSQKSYRMEIYIKQFNLPTISIKVFQNSQIKEVKMLLENILRLSYEKQILTFNSRSLKDNHCLCCYNVTEGRVLELETVIDLLDDSNEVEEEFTERITIPRYLPSVQSLVPPSIINPRLLQNNSRPTTDTTTATENSRVQNKPVVSVFTEIMKLFSRGL
jgi:uncharacterized protein YlbG (UPF0298 family)